MFQYKNDLLKIAIGLIVGITLVCYVLYITNIIPMSPFIFSKVSFELRSFTNNLFALGVNILVITFILFNGKTTSRDFLIAILLSLFMRTLFEVVNDIDFGGIYYYLFSSLSFGLVGLSKEIDRNNLCSRENVLNTLIFSFCVSLIGILSIGVLMYEPSNFVILGTHIISWTFYILLLCVFLVYCGNAYINLTRNKKELITSFIISNIFAIIMVITYLIRVKIKMPEFYSFLSLFSIITLYFTVFGLLFISCTAVMYLKKELNKSSLI